MPIKGPALAESAVRRRHAAQLGRPRSGRATRTSRRRLRDLLLDAGFRDGSPYNERRCCGATRSVGEMHLRTDDGDLRVDVHWRCTSARAGAHGLSGETLLARACALQLLGREVRGPSRGRHAAHYVPGRHQGSLESVEACLSLGVQVRDTPAGAWPRLLEAADGIGCRRSLVVGVAHTCRVLASGVPPEIAAALAPDCVARALLRSLGPGSLEHASWGRPDSD